MLAAAEKLIQVKNLKKYYEHPASRGKKDSGSVIKALDDITVDINRGDVMKSILPRKDLKYTSLPSPN